VNEPIAAVIVGLLLSLSAGVRVTLPLLAVNLLAFEQVVTLPKDFDWLGSEPTLIILIAAAVAETVVHFIPAAGTALKTAATPLAFVAGTLRAMTEPANVASLGLFGLVWNAGEMLVSIVLALLSGLCVVAGWAVGAVSLLAVITLVLIVLVKGFTRWSRSRPVTT